MDAGVIEIFGTRYYTHGFGLIFVVPFALWFATSMSRALMLAAKRKPVKWKRPGISAVFTAVIFIVVFGDVYWIGQQATRLCNENAGLHVYRTAEAESVLGLSSIEHWSKYGFKFIEKRKVKFVIFMKMENRHTKKWIRF